MSYIEHSRTTGFSWVRVILWLINVPVALFSFWFGLYAFLGGLMSEVGWTLRPLIILQPIITVAAWFASYQVWRCGSARAANLLLVVPVCTLGILFALAWIVSVL